jgi:hypothetical protein
MSYPKFRLPPIASLLVQQQNNNSSVSLIMDGMHPRDFFRERTPAMWMEPGEFVGLLIVCIPVLLLVWWIAKAEGRRDEG